MRNSPGDQDCALAGCPRWLERPNVEPALAELGSTIAAGGQFNNRCAALTSMRAFSPLAVRLTTMALVRVAA